jgi:hypothetical protein
MLTSVGEANVASAPPGETFFGAGRKFSGRRASAPACPIAPGRACHLRLHPMEDERRHV